MNDIVELEATLAKIINANRTDVPPENTLSVGTLRQATAEYLRDVTEDNRNHGVPADDPHWNLLMQDGVPVAPAQFAITIFSQSVLHIYIGIGVPQDVISLCNRFSGSQVEDVRTAFDEQYRITNNEVAVPRGLAQFWLETSVG